MASMKQNGLAKLIEECGEVLQVAGKMVQYPNLQHSLTAKHPDGNNLREKLEEELGDLLAAASFVQAKLVLNMAAIEKRVMMKVDLFIRACPKCKKEGEADRCETALTCPHCGYVWTVPLGWLRPKVSPDSVRPPMPKLRGGLQEVEIKLPGGHGPNHGLREDIDSAHRRIRVTWLMILGMLLLDWYLRR